MSLKRFSRLETTGCEILSTTFSKNSNVSSQFLSANSPDLMQCNQPHQSGSSFHTSPSSVDKTADFQRCFYIFDDILCKCLTYFLTCFSRVSYWFVSFVALERTYTTLFLNGQWFRKPSISRRLMTLTFAIVFISDAYELVFFKLFRTNDNGNSAMCILEFPVSHRTVWISIHQTISVIHSSLPLLINICCTITIVCIIIRTKMNLSMANEHK